MVWPLSLLRAKRPLLRRLPLVSPPLPALGRSAALHPLEQRRHVQRHHDFYPSRPGPRGRQRPRWQEGKLNMATKKKAAPNTDLLIGFALDRSPSMAKLTAATIAGFNQCLDEQRKEQARTFLSV